mgnify:CR=1 FL=1|tara:strand:+ start:2555 stop:3145 length:591 start_codon:yes stop_codon:yes gene_type:complete
MNKNLKDSFTSIYHTNKWGSAESKSGRGSELSQTKHISDYIPFVVDQFNIGSILDIPCGDFNYMKNIDLGCDYIGADIVSELIENNKNKYPNIRFECLDITCDELPRCDLILVRDCFVHLCNESVIKSIENIKKSGAKYLLTTSFCDAEFNKDLPSQGWRKINIELSPFNMVRLEKFNEKSTQKDAEDKSLILIKF